MKRHWLVAFAAVAVVPAVAAAQMPRPSDEGWGPFVRATPFVGFSPGFTSDGNLLVFTGGTNPQILDQQYTYSYAAGPMSGVNVEVRAHQRFSGVGSIAWSSRGHTEGSFIGDDTDAFQDSGSDFWLVKMGGSMRFNEQDPELQLRRLNASVFLGGAFIREVPEIRVLSASLFTSARNQWGVNIGGQAEMPLPNRMFAFYAAVEDYIIWWDEESIASRLQGQVRSKFGSEAVAEVDANHSHLWAVRLGLSVRFGR